MENSEKKRSFCFLCTPEETGAVQMPFFQTLIGPYGLLIDKIRPFLAAGLLYSLLLTLLSGIFGRFYSCLLTMEPLWFCGGNQSNLLYLLLKLLVLTAFMTKYYQAAFTHGDCSLKGLLQWNKTLAKPLAVTLVMIVSLLIPLLSFYLLLSRVPTPDWRLELAYFTVVSLGFFAPFVVLEFGALAAEVWGGETLTPWREIRRRNRGNFLRLLLAAFLIFLLMSFGFMFLQYQIVAFSAAIDFVPAVIVEFAYNFWLLFTLALLVNLARLQQYYFVEQFKE